MTLAKLLRATAAEEAFWGSEEVYVGFPDDMGVTREGIARGLLRCIPDVRAGWEAYRLTDRGLQWLRSHPVPRRKWRVVKVQR